MNLLTGKIGVATGNGRAFGVPVLLIVAVVVMAILAYRRAALRGTCAL